jgi:Tfp pilus assembly protein PilN
MLRTNLSTRPFYNDRIVRLGLAALAIVALGLTVFNAVELYRLQSQNNRLQAAVERDEQQARGYRDQARVIRQSLNHDALAAIEIKAREANQLIDRRAFSWTELLNQFQATLPPDVRITAVTLQIDQDGKMLVAVPIVSKKLEDVEEFIGALEATGSFSGVLSRSDTLEDDGTLKSVLQGYYHLPARATPEAIPAPPASEPAKGKS